MGEINGLQNTVKALCRRRYTSHLKKPCVVRQEIVIRDLHVNPIRCAVIIGLKAALASCIELGYCLPLGTESVPQYT